MFRSEYYPYSHPEKATSASLEQQKGPKVAILFYDFRTSGPIAVVDRISQSLQKHAADVAILSQAETLEREFRGARKIEVNPEHPWLPRSQNPARAIQKEKPDILIVEQYPFVDSKLAYGWKNAIWAAKMANPKVKIYGVVRDVPTFVTNEPDAKSAEISSKVAESFDGIIVRGDKNLIDFKDYFSEHQYARFADKLHYAGYTIPPLQASGAKKGGGVLVHFGGVPLECDESTYKGLIRLIPELGPELQQAQWRFVLPANSDMRIERRIRETLTKLPEELRNHVTIERAGPGYLEKFQAADMVIVRGGHSAVEALAYGKPAVLMPSRAKEQLVRAERAADLGKGRLALIQPGALWADTCDAINAAFAQRRIAAPACPIKINGQDSIAKAMADAHQGLAVNFNGRELS